MIHHNHGISLMQLLLLIFITENIPKKKTCHHHHHYNHHHHHNHNSSQSASLPQHVWWEFIGISVVLWITFITIIMPIRGLIFSFSGLFVNWGQKPKTSLEKICSWRKFQICHYCVGWYISVLLTIVIIAQNDNTNIFIITTTCVLLSQNQVLPTADQISPLTIMFQMFL